jgi:hypothetical protein
MKYKGHYATFDDCPPNDVSWRFYPKKRNEKIDLQAIEQELFSQGMENSLYAYLFKLGSEFPDRPLEHLDLYEPETACIILAQWCGYTVHDRSGKLLTGSTT